MCDKMNVRLTPKLLWPCADGAPRAGVPSMMPTDVLLRAKRTPDRETVREGQEYTEVMRVGIMLGGVGGDGNRCVYRIGCTQMEVSTV